MVRNIAIFLIRVYLAPMLMIALEFQQNDRLLVLLGPKRRWLSNDSFSRLAKTRRRTFDGQTDGQTDAQTKYRAIHNESRGKNHLQNLQLSIM